MTVNIDEYWTEFILNSNLTLCILRTVFRFRYISPFVLLLLSSLNRCSYRQRCKQTFTHSIRTLNAYITYELQLNTNSHAPSQTYEHRTNALTIGYTSKGKRFVLGSNVPKIHPNLRRSIKVTTTMWTRRKRKYVFNFYGREAGGAVLPMEWAVEGVQQIVQCLLSTYIACVYQ